MGELLNYTFLSSLVMTLLWLVYKICLADTTFFRLNRGVLLSIYFFSWTLPSLTFLNLNLFTGSKEQTGNIAMEFPQVVAVQNVAMYEQSLWPTVILWMWTIGMIVTLIVMAISFCKLHAIIKAGVRREINGNMEIISPLAAGPFCIGKLIVLRPEDTDDNYDLIREHEKTHIQFHHWIDLLIGQLTAVFQWYSPVAWLMIRDMKENHEFQVDRTVVAEDTRRYQLMLIKMTVGSRLPVLADSLNHSKLKKRLTMMMTKKTKSSRRFATLSIPAAALVALAGIASPAIAHVSALLANATISGTDAFRDSDNKVNTSDAGFQTFSSISSEAPTSRAVSQDASAALPDAAAAEESNGQPTHTNSSAAGEPTPKSEKTKPVVFIDGKLFEGSLSSIDSDDIAAMWVVKDDPQFPQGKILVTTKSEGAASSVTQESNDKVYLKTDKIAEYKGGMEALLSSLAQNIKCPEGVEKLTRVIVQFTINPDGRVADLKVVRSGGEECDSQALHAVEKTSGNWIPGEVDGKPVPTQFTLPVNFKPSPADPSSPGK